MGTRQRTDRRGVAARSNLPAALAPERARVDERQRQSAAGGRRAAYLDIQQRDALAESVRLVGDREADDRHRRHRREDDRPVRLGAADLLAAGQHARRRVGFNTETSPGAAVPPVESMRRMMPAPIIAGRSTTCGSSTRAGGQFTHLLDRFNDALTTRYGAPTSVEDYAMKSQLMTYEGERAMFEAYARNKYHVHRRDSVDAEQRVAVDLLAPLRLLPAAGRRLLRHEEGVRAGARAVLVRRSLDRRRQRHGRALAGARSCARALGPMARSSRRATRCRSSGRHEMRGLHSPSRQASRARTSRTFA